MSEPVAFHTRVLVSHADLAKVGDELLWAAIDHVIATTRAEISAKKGGLLGGVTITCWPAHEDTDSIEIRLDCHVVGVKL